MKAKKLFALLCALVTTATALAAEPALRYIDATTLNVIGKPMPTELAYNRLDTAVYKVPANTLGHCYMSTGIAVVFRTDSRIIQARWETSGKYPSANMPAISFKGLDLYIRRGGEWVFAGAGVPKMDGKNDMHDVRIVGSMEEGEKECLLYLPLFDQVHKLEIGIGEQSSISPMDNPFRHKIVFHGSSITHGAAASRAGMSYPALLERSTGLYCVNFGFSGRCTMQPEFATYLADVEADAFVFDAFSNPSADVINERFDTFVDIIRAKHPSTPLIFLQTICRESRNFSTSTDKFEQAKQEAGEARVRARMKTDKNIYFIDSKGIIGKDHMGTIEGTHPTDLGFMRMANSYEAPITKILKKYGIR